MTRGQSVAVWAIIVLAVVLYVPLDLLDRIRR